jgi:hypothetical protein
VPSLVKQYLEDDCVVLANRTRKESFSSAHHVFHCLQQTKRLVTEADKSPEHSSSVMDDDIILSDPNNPADGQQQTTLAVSGSLSDTGCTNRSYSSLYDRFQAIKAQLALRKKQLSESRYVGMNTIAHHPIFSFSTVTLVTATLPMFPPRGIEDRQL